MTTYKLQRELWVPRSLEEVFDFFSRAENLERITPPWMHFRILTTRPIQMHPGATIAYALRVRGIPLRWLTEIERWNPPYEFVDVQTKGPYKLWRHTHRFAEADGGTSIADIVDYALPFGPLGRLVHRFQVARDLEQIFDYRAQRVRSLFP
ncbi:MAG TPA: SRPBCC family protein [Bryobacteraceae bacterium]|nr:SRPBCC family protein [Bryobacteraceae bacterium]